MPLPAVHRLLIINSRACARVVFHAVCPAGTRVMRESAGHEGMSGFAAYVGGKLEERRVKILLPGNSSRVSMGWRWILSQEIVDKLLFQC